jgi:hypothetical protein
MNTVKVWNTNTHTLVDLFRGETIVIPARQHIVMDEDEAHLFASQFKAPIKNADGGHDPSGFKMLRIEPFMAGDVTAPKKVEYNCHVCAYKAISSEDLEEHSDLNHLDMMSDQKLAAERREALKVAGKTAKEK